MAEQDPEIIQWLLSFGFQPTDSSFSDNGEGFRFDFSNFELEASFVSGSYFQEVILFFGVLSTPRTISKVHFELPRKGMSRERLAAFIAYYLDRAADNQLFIPAKESQWLDQGRQNKHLLPWEIERVQKEKELEAYNARTRCTVEREWMKLALRSLAEILASSSDDQEVLFCFDGRSLSITCGDKDVIIGAEGTAWSSGFVIPAKNLRELPKRLMSPKIDVSIWNQRIHIDRLRYDGLRERLNLGVPSI